MIDCELHGALWLWCFFHLRSTYYNVASYEFYLPWPKNVEADSWNVTYLTPPAECWYNYLWYMKQMLHIYKKYAGTDNTQLWNHKNCVEWNMDANICLKISIYIWNILVCYTFILQGKEYLWICLKKYKPFLML